MAFADVGAVFYGAKSRLLAGSGKLGRVLHKRRTLADSGVRLLFQSPKVTTYHDVALGIIGERIQEPVAIRRYRYATTRGEGLR